MDLTVKETQEFVEIIRNITQQEIKKLDLDYSYFGVVQTKNENNTYDVKIPIEDKVYPNLYNKTTTELKVGDAVIVHTRNNNFGNAYIAIKNGYTPVPGGGSGGGTDPYVLPVATVAALGGIKSGADISVSPEGLVSVNDNSHNHIIGNISGLSQILDNKADKSELTQIDKKTLPSGGNQGQVLAKKSNNDYDAEWVNQTGGSGGGNAFGTVQSGTEKIVATSVEDILNLIAGANISLGYDQNKKSITISSTASGGGDNNYGSAIYWNYHESTGYWNV